MRLVLVIFPVDITRVMFVFVIREKGTSPAFGQNWVTMEI